MDEHEGQYSVKSSFYETDMKLDIHCLCCYFALSAPLGFSVLLEGTWIRLTRNQGHELEQAPS